MIETITSLNSPLFHISLYDLASLATLFMGLGFALLLGAAKKPEKTANLLLASALVIVVLNTSGLTSLLLPALGPLLYFYVRQLTFSNQRFRRKDLLHFCPLLAGYWLPFWLVLIWVILYLYLSHRLIQSYYSRLQPVLMDRPRFAFRQLEKILFLLGACCVLSFFNSTFYFAIALVLMGMAIQAILKADSDPQLTTPITDRSDAREKGRRLKEAVATNRLYEEAELTLTTLAMKLAIHPHDLSRIINIGLEKNFSDFINEFRVREVARNMQDPAYDRLTLLGIAYESGFNSERTFQRVFKEMTGKTPSEYKNSLKKVPPIDKLAALPRIRPVILRSESPPVWAAEKSNPTVMFRNYLKIAFRNLVKDRVQSFVNISGLAIGFAVALLAGLWVWDELSFDSYNTNYSTITQIARKEITKGDINISEGSNHFPVPLAAELRTDYSNLFRQVTLSTEKGGHILAANNENKHTLQGMFVEKGFTDVFTLKLTAGSDAGFSEPNNILIGQSAAQKLFGNADAIGKVLKLDNTQPLTVIGVYQDLPLNNSFSGTDFFCPFDLLGIIDPGMKNKLSDWNNSSFFIYADLQPGISAEKASTAIKDAYWAKIKSNPNMAPGYKAELFLHPMKDWHLHSEWKNGVRSGGQIQTVRLFSLIGIFVLLLACINFINLSTARSGKRAKEIGIRKTMGSQRSQLIIQFLDEVFLTVLLAALLGLAIVLLSLPGFNQIAGKHISFPWRGGWFWLSAVLFILVTTLVSGSYPALYLSSFNPIKVLKGTVKPGKYAALPRKALLTVQFVVSIILIIGTIVVYRQIKLAQDRPVGYDRKGLVRVTMTTPDLKGKYEVLRQALLSSGGATDVAESSSSATGDNYFDDRFDWEGKSLGPHNQSFALMAVTPEYAKTVGWQFIQGRNFTRDLASDNAGVILNEAALKYMGLQHPLGQIIRWNGKPFTVVGVIRDMVKGSPYQPVGQSLFFNAAEIGPEITIRLNPVLSASQALARIEPVFRQLNPSAPFDYTFIDDEYAQKFAAEQRTGNLSGIFAALAVFISCLGVFGLASFIAEQRIKEIGIRKVLGASTFNIWQMFSKDFIVIILISLCIAIPVAYYAAHKWLENYQYKTTLAWWIFLLGGAGVLMITLLTASYHAVKAALANPVKSLRVE